MAERARNGCVSISNKEIDLIYDRYHDAETVKVALSILPQIGPPNRKDEANEDELSVHGNNSIDFADENNSANNEDELSDHESTGIHCADENISTKNDTGSNSPKKKRQKTSAVKKVKGAVVARKKQPVVKLPKEDTVEEEDDEEKGIVEKVLGILVVDEVIMFHIKWRGYPLKYGNGKDYMEPIEIMETHMGENRLIGKLVVSIHIIFLRC